MRICVIRGFDSPLERDGSGNVVAGSTHGAAGLLSRGSVQYQFDNLGDVTIRLDGSGNVLSYRLFDAWGNELSSGGEPCGYRARYGYYADGETGLIALAFRYYAPGVGRFLNRDPIGFEGGPVLYSYARRSPVVHRDPAGLQVIDFTDYGAAILPPLEAGGESYIDRPGAVGGPEPGPGIDPGFLESLNAHCVVCDRCKKQCLDWIVATISFGAVTSVSIAESHLTAQTIKAVLADYVEKYRIPVIMARLRCVLGSIPTMLSLTEGFLVGYNVCLYTCLARS